MAETLEHEEALLTWLGVKILAAAEGPPAQAVAELPMGDHVRNTAGVLNGGVVATLVDVVGGVAAARATGSRNISTSGMNVHYLAPVVVGPARATARVVRTGRRSVVATVELVDAGDDDRLAAVGTISLAVRAE